MKTFVMPNITFHPTPAAIPFPCTAVGRARGIVIDVTGGNPNVMYELGQVHARGVSPLLIIRRPLTQRTYIDLPFYLQHQRLVAAADNEPGRRYLGRELGAISQPAGERHDWGAEG